MNVLLSVMAQIAVALVLAFVIGHLVEDEDEAEDVDELWIDYWEPVGRHLL